MRVNFNLFIAFLFVFSFRTLSFADVQNTSIKKYQFIMLRHAKAPGTGDPVNFKLGDCRTQRNLSLEGRQQAQKIGRSLPDKITVYSSQWCRTLDTAKNLNKGPVIELDLLNSFFNERSRENVQTQNLKKWIKSEIKKESPFILVTHQVNITALTDIFPEEGELLFLHMKDENTFEVVKRLKP